MTAAERGLRFPNCYLCEHYCFNEDIDSYECEIKKAVVEKGSDALNCNSYVLKNDAFDKLKNRSITLNIIDTWPKYQEDNTHHNY